MNINWDLVLKIVVPLATLGLGKYLDRWIEKKPRLLIYLGHASAFTIRGNPGGIVHTHAVVGPGLTVSALVEREWFP